MATPTYDFPAIGDNIPRVTKVLRDLCHRLKKGDDGGDELPEWADTLVDEALAHAGLGGVVKGTAAEPVPAIEGGHWEQTEEGLNTGAGVQVQPEVLDELPDSDKQAPDDAVIPEESGEEESDDSEQDEPPEKDEDDLDGLLATEGADGSASDLQMAGGGATIPEPTPPPGQSNVEAPVPPDPEEPTVVHRDGGGASEDQKEQEMKDGAEYL